jgi:hypothetical protein
LIVNCSNKLVSGTAWSCEKYAQNTGELEGKIPFGTARRRSEDCTEIEVVCACGLDSTGSVQIPVAVSCEYGNERLSSIAGEEFLNISFSRRTLTRGVSCVRK